MKNKSQETQNKLIVVLLFLNLALHFTKLFFEPYRSDLPISIRKVTFENICAVSVLIFPILYLSKKRALKDYMVYFGILGGASALFVPTEALGFPFFSYDAIRFYLVHIIILITPILMLNFKLHNLDYKKYYQSLLLFVLVLVLIMINEVILVVLGWSDKPFFLHY